MKTSPEQKIKDDIRREYAKTYPNCIFSLTNYVERLKAERAALEADNAAKDKALAKIKEYAGDVSEYMDEIVLKSTAAYGDPSAMTPDSGKVLVDVEKLRELEWIKHVSNSPDPSEKDVEYWVCPACKEGKDGAHTANCWLAALLKDRP